MFLYLLLCQVRRASLSLEILRCRYWLALVLGRLKNYRVVCTRYPKILEFEAFWCFGLGFGVWEDEYDNMV